MGCDGGTIPKRDELVRTKRKPEQKDKSSELSFRWRHCSVSQEPLRNPIVACGLGRLYNKDVIIEKLLEKSPLPETASHIKSLKDIKDLKLTSNLSFTETSSTGDVPVDHQTAPHICPISGIEMSGKFKFCFSWVCGCVISERALKQVKDSICINCQQPYTESDVVILNAIESDADLMRDRLVERAAKLKSGKKSKKVANGICKTDNKNVEIASTSTAGEIASTSTVGEIASTSTAIKVDEICGENQIHSSNKNAEVGLRESIKKKNSEKISSIASCSNSIASSSNVAGIKRNSGELIDPAYKKSKSTYSISKDPKASDVYKSLFTTHKDAKSHAKAHWVTYNPFYN